MINCWRVEWEGDKTGLLKKLKIKEIKGLSLNLELIVIPRFIGQRDPETQLPVLDLDATMVSCVGVGQLQVLVLAKIFTISLVPPHLLS